MNQEFAGTSQQNACNQAAKHPAFESTDGGKTWHRVGTGERVQAKGRMDQAKGNRQEYTFNEVGQALIETGMEAGQVVAKVTGQFLQAVWKPAVLTAGTGAGLYGIFLAGQWFFSVVSPWLVYGTLVGGAFLRIAIIDIARHQRYKRTKRQDKGPGCGCETNIHISGGQNNITINH